MLSCGGSFFCFWRVMYVEEYLFAQRDAFSAPHMAVPRASASIQHCMYFGPQLNSCDLRLCVRYTLQQMNGDHSVQVQA